tara:strand:- start:152 stop:286 length:135 start_codon:yes stop_codon:yes gene_type:complete
MKSLGISTDNACIILEDVRKSKKKMRNSGSIIRKSEILEENIRK